MERRDFVMKSTLAFLVGSDAGESGATATAADHFALATRASPRDFGAVGDGVADDTAAINRGLRAATVLLVPRGRYRFAAQVHVPPGSALMFLGGDFLLSTGASLVVDGYIIAPPLACIRLAGGSIGGSPQNAIIEVDWFGPDKTGANACDEAIAAALSLAIAPRVPRGARQLRFGAGTYRVSRNSIFLPAGRDPAIIVGLTIQGAGAESTALALAPSQKGPHYFFANERDEIRARAWTIRDIGFEADKSSTNASSVNGFLFGRDYDFSYQRVAVRVPGTVWQVAGTQLGSEHRFSNCFLSGTRVVLLDNLQAVNTQFTATDAWSTGPLLDVRNGGLITWLGGSIALLGNDSSNTFLRTEERGFPGYSGNAKFVSVNVEIHNPQAKVIDFQGAYGQFRGRFDGCKFWPAVGEPRVMFQFRRGNHIVFRDCTFDPKSLFDIGGPAQARLQPKMPAHALIGFESCTGISRAQVSYSGALAANDGIARVYSRGSTFELMSALAEGEPVARDFDLNWRGVSGTAVIAHTISRKLFHLSKAVGVSPKIRPGNAALTFALPEGATLTGIHLRKLAGGGGDRRVRLVAIAEGSTTPFLVSEWTPISRELEARSSFDLLSGPVLSGGQQRIACGLEAESGFAVPTGSALVECVVEYV